MKVDLSPRAPVEIDIMQFGFMGDFQYTSREVVLNDQMDLDLDFSLPFSGMGNPRPHKQGLVIWK
jgi:hypothetical protein